jgi:hypothetical protein
MHVNKQLQLADAHMLHMRRSQAQRDTGLACNLYYDAAEAGHPEAMVQVAMLNFAQFNPARDGMFNFLAPIRRPRTAKETQLLQDMWKNLEGAASMDYVCPFLLRQAENALRDGSWVLSNTVRNILARNDDAVVSRVEAQELRKTSFSERVSVETGIQIGEYKCYNPACPNKDLVGLKFKKCKNCSTATYCGSKSPLHDLSIL